MADSTALVTESESKRLTQPFEAPLSELDKRLQELRSMPLSRTSVGLYQEWDGDAQKCLKALSNSELASQIGAAFKLHRFLTGAMKKFTQPIEYGRALAANAFRDWDRTVKQKAEAERRERERIAKDEQERLRLEEAEHLEQLGHKEEAEALISAPLPPVSLPEPAEPAGKLDGVSVTTVRKFGKVTDGKAFYTWLAENPAFYGFMEPRAGDWKRVLTANGGNLTVPGLEIETTTETRHRSE